MMTCLRFRVKFNIYIRKTFVTHSPPPTSSSSADPTKSKISREKELLPLVENLLLLGIVPCVCEKTRRRRPVKGRCLVSTSSAAGTGIILYAKGSLRNGLTMYPKGFRYLLYGVAFLPASSSTEAFITHTGTMKYNAPVRTNEVKWTLSPVTTSSRSSEPPRNGKSEPSSVQKNERDVFVQDLQSEIASLYERISQQKMNYETTMGKLQVDADRQLEEAQERVDLVKNEYEAYQADVRWKLENAVTPAQVARLEEEVQRLDEQASMFKSKLDDALGQLRQNREDRKMLQAEMVALKESYIDKLNELEDQLEFAQDESVRAQQEGAKRVAEIQEESKQKLKAAIEEGRKQVDELTLMYTQRMALKDEEIATTKNALGQARRAVREKEDVIDHLEAESNSIRKLLRKSISLARGRVSKRVRSMIPGRRRQD